MGLTDKQTIDMPNVCLQLRLVQYLATPQTSGIGIVDTSNLRDRHCE